jgi:hypothetical protein
MHIVMPPSQSIPTPVFITVMPSRHFQTLRQPVGTNTSYRYTIQMTKASFHAQIDEAHNSARLMARWVRELQHRSEAICDSKVSENRMIT